MENNNYRVPKAVYYQCLWLVKDMDRLRKLEAVSKLRGKNEELIFFVDDEEIIRDAGVLEQAEKKLECIRRSLQAIPAEYRQGTVDCIAYNVPFADTAHENTWRKWRQVFISELAKNLLLI